MFSNATNVNVLWSLWHKRFLEVMDICIPKKRLPPKKHLPWLSPILLNAIKRRNSLFRTYKRTASVNKFEEYKKQRNLVTTAIRHAKRSFLNQLYQADSKTFWRVITSLSKQPSSIPTLSTGDSRATNDYDKANCLNNQFYNNFNFSHPPLNTVPPLAHPNPEHCPDDFLCTEDEVFGLILGLDNSKSTGPDEISAKMLKGTIFSIVPSLTKLFNLSIQTCSFPNLWKYARIVPIPKKGDLSLPENYRPISILSLLSKLLERHVYQTISNHLLIHYPISDRQWGFSHGKSTTTALLSFSHDCLQTLDNKAEVCSVFFDISKAFDSVPHVLLLHKLSSINLNPYITRWVQSYLTHRSQYVVINGTESPALPVVSGVPQGSVLGPLLFLIYINDVTCVVSNGKIIIYADDIALYQIIHSPSDFILVQQDINSICAWVDENSLLLNTLKCCYLLFSRKPTPTFPSSPLLVNNTALHMAKEFKYLGVTFSSDTSWTPHINTICLKSRKLVGMLFRKFYCHTDSHSLLKLYLSTVRPHLEYASSVWDPYLKKNIEAIEHVQKFALKVCLKDWHSDYDTLLISANVPPLATRRKALKLCQLFTILQGYAKFPDFPTSRRTSPYLDCIRSTNSATLSQLFAHTTLFQNSFFLSTIKLWNTLPYNICTLQSLPHFKQAVSIICYASSNVSS